MTTAYPDVSDERGLQLKMLLQFSLHSSEEGEGEFIVYSNELLTLIAFNIIYPVNILQRSYHLIPMQLYNMVHTRSMKFRLPHFMCGIVPKNYRSGVTVSEVQ